MEPKKVVITSVGPLDAFHSSREKLEGLEGTFVHFASEIPGYDSGIFTPTEPVKFQGIETGWLTFSAVHVAPVEKKRKVRLRVWKNP